MNLYTDDNPQTTLKGLGFKNKESAINTIKTVENYFNNMLEKQIIPGYTPNNVLPKKYLENNQQKYQYYQTQKMYRILGMLNRARGMINKIKNKKYMNQAIIIFENWMNKYKKL